MAIVITNGKQYLKYGESKKILFTNKIEDAYQFPTSGDAIAQMKRAKRKTKYCYVLDTFNNMVYWKWKTQEELILEKENNAYRHIKRDSKGKIVRKTYSRDTRKIIYNNAKGRCELCGREILFEDMTLDHIKPLSMGGVDEVDNLACTCYGCNGLKGNALPEKFEKRVTDIFLYQMGKKCKGKLSWWIVQRLLMGLI